MTVARPCGHAYCRDCIVPLTESYDSRCPLCRCDIVQLHVLSSAREHDVLTGARKLTARLCKGDSVISVAHKMRPSVYAGDAEREARVFAEALAYAERGGDGDDDDDDDDDGSGGVGVIAYVDTSNMDLVLMMRASRNASSEEEAAQLRLQAERAIERRMYALLQIQHSDEHW